MSDPLAEILNKARLQLGRKRFGGDGALALQLIADLCNEIQRLHNPPKPKQHFKCSFCGKRDDQVTKLIAGPSTFICNECIELCNEIIEAEPLATASKEGGE